MQAWLKSVNDKSPQMISLGICISCSDFVYICLGMKKRQLVRNVVLLFKRIYLRIRKIPQLFPTTFPEELTIDKFATLADDWMEVAKRIKLMRNQIQVSY